MKLTDPYMVRTKEQDIFMPVLRAEVFICALGYEGLSNNKQPTINWSFGETYVSR